METIQPSLNTESVQVTSTTPQEKLPFIIRRKTSFYFGAIVAVTSYLIYSIAGVSAMGFDAVWILFGIPYVAFFFFIVGVVGLIFSLSYKDTIEKGQFNTNILKDIIVVTALTPTLLSFTLALLIKPVLDRYIPAYQASIRASQDKQNQKELEGMREENRKMYQYLTEYFKQPRKVHYVIGTFLVLDGNIKIRLAGMRSFRSIEYTDYNNAINKKLKDTYLGKSWYFGLPPEEEFIRLGGSYSSIESDHIDPMNDEERKLYESLPKPVTSDSRRLEIGPTDNVAILSQFSQ
jgi:hypothetical protein